MEHLPYSHLIIVHIGKSRYVSVIVDMQLTSEPTDSMTHAANSWGSPEQTMGIQMECKLSIRLPQILGLDN